jgi:transposase
MKSREEIMEILEAFDLTASFRDAAELAGCSHHTVAAWVAKREAGRLPIAGEVQRRERKIDPYLPKVEEWVERSRGKIRADVVFRRLRQMGFTGSERTVRRAVGEAKRQFGRGNHRVYRPWIPEPGMWA